MLIMKNKHGHLGAASPSKHLSALISNYFDANCHFIFKIGKESGKFLVK